MPAPPMVAPLLCRLGFGSGDPGVRSVAPRHTLSKPHGESWKGCLSTSRPRTWILYPRKGNGRSDTYWSTSWSPRSHAPGESKTRSGKYRPRPERRGRFQGNYSDVRPSLKIVAQASDTAAVTSHKLHHHPNALMFRESTIAFPRLDSYSSVSSHHIECLGVQSWRPRETRVAGVDSTRGGAVPWPH